MQVAFVIIGAVFGLVFGSRSDAGATFFATILGGFAGYTLAELASLRARNGELEREVGLLKERLSALWRRQKEAQQGSSQAEVSQQKTATRELPAAPVAGGAPVPPRAAVYDAREPSHATASDFGSGNGSLFDIPIFRFLRDYFTGGNTLVRVGVLILFFGVAFLLRYLAEHSHVPIQFRLSAVALGGFVLLILGWRLRSRRLGYALALQGGGVGILYLTTFAALRLYLLIPPSVAFGLLVTIAAFSAALAVWQNSQAFAVLAVTGGFLAPILASTGAGSHVVLFTYYAIVNASILAISWYRAWRPLNVVGFAFTFIISTAWGALHYEDRLFDSTEPFLVLFFIFYVAIAILFSIRQPPQLRGYVDGTLLFGTPMAAFGYQSAMLHQRPVALAWSAVVLGIFYFLVAWVLRRGKRGSQRLLVEAFMALGVVFLTVAAPLGLSSHKTGATWALEAVALVWVGVRQDRVLARVFGVLVQLAAGLVLLGNIERWDAGATVLGDFLARTLVAVGAVFSAVILQKYVERLRSYEAPSSAVLFFFGLLIWIASGLHQLDGHVPAPYVMAAEVGFLGFSALACSELACRTVLALARLPALGLLPALILWALSDLASGVHHPFENGGWLAWGFDLGCLYVILRRHAGDPQKPLASWLHALSGWLTLVLLTWELVRSVARVMSGHGSWAAVSWILLPSLVLVLLPRLIAKIPWPFKVHRDAYVMLFGACVGVYLALWSLVTNFSLSGDPYPFPYVPLLNALDLAQALVLLVLTRFWLYLRTLGNLPESDVNAAAAGSVGFLGFVWLNAALCRTLHHWAGVPFDFDALMESTLVQTALSIFWTVLALATMLVATRRASRRVWLTGAILLAVTIVKLFVVDLSRVGTVERIVSFVGVGLLTLVIGYFSPLPPAARETRTTVS